jgi:hypothetical protein
MMTDAQLREAAMALPEAEERETWGSATFRVRDKIFVIMGAEGVSASIKASREDQGALIAAEPGTFSSSEYTGRFGWVTARLATAQPDEIGDLVTEAWRRTAPKRLVAKFDAGRSQPV